MTTGIDFSPLVDKQQGIKRQDSSGDRALIASQGGLRDMSNKELFVMLLRKLRPQKLLKSTGEFRDPSKRLRIIFVSVLIPVLFILIFFAFPGLLGTTVGKLLGSLLLAAISVFLTMWSLKYDFNSETGRLIVVFVANFVFVMSFFLHVLFPRELSRVLELVILLGLLGGFTASLYVLYLTQNVINVSFIKYIPLFDSAHRSLFVYVLVTAFLSGFAALSLAKAGMVLALIAVIMYLVIQYISLLMYVRLCVKDLWGARLVTLGITLSSLILGVILSLFQVSTASMSFGLTLVVFIGMHLLLHNTLAGFKKRFIFEYFAFFLVFFLVLGIDFYL